MIQHLVVAGYDFQVGTGIDLSAMADRYARSLVQAAAGPVEVTLLDAPSGLRTRYDRAGGGVRIGPPTRVFGEMWTSPRYEDAVVDHEPDPDWPGPIHPSQRVLRRDQLDLMSILDVYDAILDVGLTRPRELGEVAFFTHGSADGPRLFGSVHRDGHELATTSGIMWFPTPGLTRPTVGAAAPHGPYPPAEPHDPFDLWRDPCDTDARVARDVWIYGTDLWGRSGLREAFASEGRVRVFGGTRSDNDYELLFATAWSDDLQLDGAPADVVRVKYLSRTARALARLALSRGAPVTEERGALRVTRGAWTRFVRARLHRCWAARMAGLLGVPVLAPPPGLVVPHRSYEGPAAGGSDDVAVLAECAATLLGTAVDLQFPGHVRFDPA